MSDIPNEEFYRNAMRFLEERTRDDPALCLAVRRYVRELRAQIKHQASSAPTASPP